MTDGRGRPGWATYVCRAVPQGRGVARGQGEQGHRASDDLTTLEGWEPASIPAGIRACHHGGRLSSSQLQRHHGTRLRVDYAIVPHVTPYVATTLLIDKDTEGLHFNDSEETILHPMAGVEWQKGHWAAQFNAGMRTDKRKDTAEGSDRMVHVDGTFHFPSWRRGAGGRHRRQEVRVGRHEQQQEDFLEMANALVWHRGEKWSLCSTKTGQTTPGSV